MSGHSRWATIKRKKGLADAKKGKVFTKLIKEVVVAARMGGGDVNTNTRLRSAVAAARAQNMPGENIERAIKRGTGELEGITYEETTYEGYGPGGVAILVDIMTDSKQRTVAEIRYIFTHHGGNMGEAGCVSWNFEKKGILAIDKATVSEEKLMEVALDAGAEDVRDVGSNFEVITDPHMFEAVKGKIETAGIKFVLAEVAKLPKNTVQLEGKNAEQMVRLVEELEDNDDVQHVYTNSDIAEDVMEKIAGA
ncbi:MAG TPA: YebC/PmpR family DNA-binding transcriptional regulator [Bdellovibrionota bacterium]|nr:YebC/PmpR family DNA-binding transcriptional regulator [Bdellovibrionota bacterium]